MRMYFLVRPCFEGNDPGFTCELACSPTERPQEEKNEGDKRGRPCVMDIRCFLCLAPLPLGNKTSLTPSSSNGPLNQTLVQGLGLRPKQDQSVNFPESDIRMLKGSRNISTGIAKLTRESRILMATLSNSGKTFIYKRSK